MLAGFFEIFIAGKWKKNPKSVKKPQLYYSVRNRFPNEAGKELGEIISCCCPDRCSKKRLQLKISFLVVPFPLLSLKVQLGFFPHTLYLLHNKERKKTNKKSDSSFLFGQGKSSLEMFFI